jgi:hypothetical protein
VNITTASASLILIMTAMIYWAHSIEMGDVHSAARAIPTQEPHILAAQPDIKGIKGYDREPSLLHARARFLGSKA